MYPQNKLKIASHTHQHMVVESWIMNTITRTQGGMREAGERVVPAPQEIILLHTNQSSELLPGGKVSNARSDGWDLDYCVDD